MTSGGGRLPGVMGVWLAIATGALAFTTIDPSNTYAYAANVGWINARGDGTNGAVIGAYYCTGFVYGANIGWIKLASGVPANGYAFANNLASDFGVNHDGAGALRGHAYGANIGWLSFESNGNPRVDLRTGNLSGYVWGANIGWISLSNAVAFVRTTSLDTGPDSDGDDLPDAYELMHTNTTGALDGRFGTDTDGDGSPDIDELGADTDPTDGDDNLRITTFTAEHDTNTVAWTARLTRLYRLHSATNVADTNAWADAGPGLMGPPPASPMQHTLTGVTPTGLFYRVEAVLPLSE